MNISVFTLTRICSKASFICSERHASLETKRRLSHMTGKSSYFNDEGRIQKTCSEIKRSVISLFFALLYVVSGLWQGAAPYGTWIVGNFRTKFREVCRFFIHVVKIPISTTKKCKEA